ncbi:MAG: FKBP-type peptidyl-prolyl cis-trans isomerase [Nitrospiraceae bacterium]|nr:MAG: FKBP-type peptidyl-prolyl cis-trans isomerase [Nitrospiraceae bacterium]
MSGAISARLFILSCFLLLTSSHLFAADVTQPPETQKEKDSYSIGYQVGVKIRSDDIDVDFEKLTQGLQTGIDGKEPLLSQEEIKELIAALTKKKRDTVMRKIQEQIVKNAEESQKFLAENGKKEGVRITESGLQYRILQEGEGMTPKVEDFVKVHYRGTLTDGREFDNSYSKGAPQTVQADGVIKGWTEALQMMKVGSKWEIFVPPHLAYGRRGYGEKIPPNSVLLFEIELLSIEKEEETEGRES